uniref:Uncharacterized protein n=1 Tax=Amphilophus citrinellus TaxID=61819 RepID=A0A3Q0SRI3_AMPCI
INLVQKVIDLVVAACEDFLADVSQRITLKKPAGAILRIGGLEDTVYKDYPADVNGWGKFYLPKTVTMQVVGVVEGISCPCDQLVLMTCEDKRVYAYDEEELHLVASSMEQLREEGMTYPASKTYYNGEAFKNMGEAKLNTKHKEHKTVKIKQEVTNHDARVNLTQREPKPDQNRNLNTTHREHRDIKLTQDMRRGTKT